VASLAQFVVQYIRKNDLVRPGDRVGLAVSGGADSVTLLRILLELRQELGIVLSVVHLNHLLRGAEADADEQFVRDLARSHQLEFIGERRDVRAYAAEHKLSLETAAREVRYGFFERLLREKRLDKIATAHTLDDQAETVLLKLLRGSGTRGLAGIYPQRKVLPGTGHIVRPMLGVQRSEVESYLAALGQTWREDSSNQELRHTRNRIRHEVLPVLERVSPGLRKSLADVAEIARAEEEYWSAEVTALLPSVFKNVGRTPRIGGSVFWGTSLAMQRRLLRAAADSLGLALEFQQVSDILDVRQGGSVALTKGWTARLHKREIRFESSAARKSEYEYPLPVPGKVDVPEIGVTLESSLVNVSEPQQDDAALISPQLAGAPFVVRNWCPGDRFWPAHRKTEKKVKELLQDRHITGPEKKLWPVIASGDRVVWLRGFGVHREFQSKDGVGILILDLGKSDAGEPKVEGPKPTHKRLQSKAGRPA
jgi:tRNA(Ile)-lysidine synthase